MRFASVVSTQDSTIPARSVISTTNMCKNLSTGYKNKLKGMHMEICITVRHPRCGHQKKNPLDTLEPPEDHRVCTKKLI